jgi:hypothetical protein
MKMLKYRSVKAATLALGLCVASGPALAWFGPSEEKPYALHATSAVPADFTTWNWADKRGAIRTANLATKDGYLLADNVIRPQAVQYLPTEFAHQVHVHAEQESIAEKLNGKTIEILQLEVSIGLWLRLGERQSGKWETVRVMVQIRIDGQTFDAMETHPFKSGETPSPVAAPMREAAKNLVEQIHQFF